MKRSIDGKREYHGKRSLPEYRAWAMMKNRCLNPNAEDRHNYSERGITICDRWKDSFAAFIEDMGERPSKDHSIERIDNDGNYEPNNCRWATKLEQSRNRRTNVHITHNGRTQLMIDWAKEVGLQFGTLRTRIFKYGWSIEKSLTTHS